jgi:rhomboid-like protein
MALLYFMGIRLHDEVGRANFLAIYFATGIFGSFTSLTYHVLRSNFATSSLGASGAISGMIGTYLWLNKDEPVSIFAYILPADSSFTMPKWFPLSCFIFIELYSIWRSGKRPPTMDHWAHLGGYVSGMIAADGLNYRRAELRKAEMERRKKQGLIDRIKEGRL